LGETFGGKTPEGKGWFKRALKEKRGEFPEDIVREFFVKTGGR